MQRSLIAIIALAGAAPALAAETVLPAGYAGIAGNVVFNGILGTTQRTFQWLIHSDQLTGLVGHNLTGIAFRMASASADSWPAGEASITSWDLRLSEGVAPADRTLAVLAANAVGTQTLVRSGPLTIPAGAYQVNPSSPHPFGPRVVFDEPYHYAGRHLLVELRYTGISGTTTRNVDAVGTSASTGYGTQFSALWVGNYAATTSGVQGNFVIIQFTSEPATQTCYGNCDESTTLPVLNVADFTCFLQRFAAGEAYANCDESTTAPVLNVADFTCFLQSFAAGCP